jgi:hypothetical protein
MRAIVRVHFFPAIIAAIVVFTLLPFVESIIRINKAAQAAVEWHSGKAITTEVSPGGVLEIIYKATVHKQCPSDVRGFLIAPDGSVPVRLPTVFGGYTRATGEPSDIKVTILIPPAPDPGRAPYIEGDYLYRTLVTRYCAEGVEDDIYVPDVPFRMRLPA